MRTRQGGDDGEQIVSEVQKFKGSFLEHGQYRRGAGGVGQVLVDQEGRSDTDIRMGKQLHTYRDWDSWQRRKQDRRRILETAAHVVALQALFLALYAQLRRGFLSGETWSETVAWGVLAVAGIVNALLVIYPDRGTALLARISKQAGILVLGRITTILLILFYVATLPFAATGGRRRYVRRHHSSAPWVTKTAWRQAAWSHKTSEADTTIEKKGTLIRMAGYFISRGNIIILIIVAILLIAVSLSILAHTPYLAPFVYTIF